METNNSLVQHLLDVFGHLLRDVADMCSVASVNRDLDFVKARAAKEGVSFFTKSLPLLGKGIDLSLAQSTPFLAQGFARSPGRTTPKFLGWLFEGVFDTEGRELLDARPDYVRHLRQLAYYFYKLELPYKDHENKTVIDRFVDNDHRLGEVAAKCSDSSCRILRTSRALISRVMAGVRIEGFIPRHGPGAVSGGELQWQKYRHWTHYTRLAGLFSWEENWASGAMDICDNYRGFHAQDTQAGSIRENPEGAGTAKVVLVPKDSRGPRLISCEPKEYQYIQQGISRELVRVIESHSYTRGRVNFTDQTINQRYALYGSMGAQWVTLDMKDASDLVSTSLVENLFGGSHVLPYLMASRSTRTKLPNGKIVILNKFAPMGSALCFPVEALVFWALSVACSAHSCTDPVRFSDKLERALEGTKVYGDDLIVRKEDYLALLQFFPTVGLQFNEKKCCFGGSFRESCGVDAYKGYNVTPTRYRTKWDPRSTHTKQLLSNVELSNHLYQRGYWNAADEWMNLIVRKYGPIPIVTHDRPVSFICFRRITSSLYDVAKLPTKYCKKTHRVLIKTLVVHTPVYFRRLSGWEKLRWRLIQPSSPLTVEPRCLRAFAKKFQAAAATEVCMFPIRRRVTHKRRWCSYEQ